MASQCSICPCTLTPLLLLLYLSTCTDITLQSPPPLLLSAHPASFLTLQLSDFPTSRQADKLAPTRASASTQPPAVTFTPHHTPCNLFSYPAGNGDSTLQSPHNAITPPCTQPPPDPPHPVITQQQGSTARNVHTSPHPPAAPTYGTHPPHLAEPLNPTRFRRLPPGRLISRPPVPPAPLPARPANSPTFRLPNKSTSRKADKLASAPAYRG